MRDARGHADALEAGACHHQRIGRPDLAAVRQPLLVAAIELCNPRIGGAAIMDHGRVRKQPAQIGGAAHRVGADHKTLAARGAETVQRQAGTQHQRIIGGVARQHRRDDKPRRLLMPGTSFSECIAACSVPDRIASRISATKAPPLPP